MFLSKTALFTITEAYPIIGLRVAYFSFHIVWIVFFKNLSYHQLHEPQQGGASAIWRRRHGDVSVSLLARGLPLDAPSRMWTKQRRVKVVLINIMFTFKMYIESDWSLKRHLP